MSEKAKSLTTKRRIQLDLSEDSARRLDDLKKITESNYTSVVRNALKIYEELIRRAERGENIYVKNERGEMEAWRIFA
jgi:hypothetical protein